MKFNRLVREDNQIQTIYDKPNADGHLEQFDITAHEAPRPEMDKALEALGSVCIEIAELAEPLKGMAVYPYGLTVSYTKHGTRKCSIQFKRLLRATGKTYKFKTPSFQIDDPAEGEETNRECSKEQAELITAAINEGIRYAMGERSQHLLPLEDDTAEPSDGTPSDGDLFDGEQTDE